MLGFPTVMFKGFIHQVIFDAVVASPVIISNAGIGESLSNREHRRAPSTCDVYARRAGRDVQLKNQTKQS